MTSFQTAQSLHGTTWHLKLPGGAANAVHLPSLPNPTYTRYFNEVKLVGEINSTARTADQSTYAVWWYEYSDIGWNRVARTQAASNKIGLYATAHMFALLS